MKTAWNICFVDIVFEINHIFTKMAFHCNPTKKFLLFNSRSLLLI